MAVVPYVALALFGLLVYTVSVGAMHEVFLRCAGNRAYGLDCKPGSGPWPLKRMETTGQIDRENIWFWSWVWPATLAFTLLANVLIVTVRTGLRLSRLPLRVGAKLLELGSTVPNRRRRRRDPSIPEARVVQR